MKPAVRFASVVALCSIVLASTYAASSDQEGPVAERPTGETGSPARSGAAPVVGEAEGKGGKGETGGSTDLGSLGFGFGIGVSFLNEDDITGTQVENGIVRVTDSDDQQREAWLVTQYLLDRFKLGRYVSHGPFVALQVSDSDGLFDSLAAGYMLSFKRTPIDVKTNKLAFNIGVGIVSTSIDVLGDGIQENEPLPEGVESVRLRSKDETAAMILFSFSVL